MPNPNKKARGRRPKIEEEEGHRELHSYRDVKRKKLNDSSEPIAPASIEFLSFNAESGTGPPWSNHVHLQNSDTPFFGLLNEEEQKYFAQAQEILETDSFDDNEGEVQNDGFNY